MKEATISLQDLRRRIYRKAKAVPDGTLSLYFFQEPVSTLQTVTYENCLFL